jgi:hypothetical protein
MKILFYCSIFLFALNASAQSSGLEFFTEEGENFTLTINGVRTNAVPTTNVKMDGLSGDGVKVRIVFEKQIPPFDKFVMLTPGETSVFAIRKNKKGEYALRMVSTGPSSTSPVEESQIPSPHPSVENNPTGAIHTSVSTTSTTSQTADAGNVSMSMNVNGVTMGANVVVNENQPGIAVTVAAGMPTHVTTTTTVTSSSTVISSDEKIETQNVQRSQETSCSMSATDYNAVVSSVKSKSFADIKLTVLKQAIKNQCVEASQVKSLADLLSFEEDKLDFAKFAYDYTSDKKNYYRVNDAFAHESTIDELNDFLESKR